MAGTDPDLIAEVRRLGTVALGVAAGTALAPTIEGILARLDEPLRVAIVGRVKAGKSTLLNALVGERLAATDAGECTKIVTWYRHALGYEVTAALRPGGTRDLRFRREDGALHIDLDGLTTEAVERIDVGWPSQKLADLMLIDTPGLGSVDERSSERTTTALLDRGAGPGEADAVIYLMRHLHRSDARFLEAFIERSIAHASPVNAIVVLSRADEIGGARPDALDSARSIASRYAADRRVRDLASGVVPIAGLLAETGATLRQAQFDWLSALARLRPEDRDALLVSVDRFRDPDRGPLAADVREELLARFGLFGLRLAVGLIADGAVRTATDLSHALLERSGIGELQRVLRDRYAARADVLRARSALAALRAAGSDLARDGAAGATELLRALDRLEAASGELALLRLQHLVLAGLVELPEAEEAEIGRLSVSGSPPERLGLPVDASGDDVRDAAVAAIERWRVVAGNPLSDRRMVEAAEIVSRAYEQIHAASA
jgi:GTP-binding protein EngB required for normal cell division